jgi:hypothetical protein
VSSGSGYPRLLQGYRFGGSFLRTTTTHHQCRLSLFSKPQLYFSVSQRTTYCGLYTQLYIWSIPLRELYLYFLRRNTLNPLLISCKILDLTALAYTLRTSPSFVPVVIPLEWCEFISTSQHARPVRFITICVRYGTVLQECESYECKAGGGFRDRSR